jgi:hypothetical protein
MNRNPKDKPRQEPGVGGKPGDAKRDNKDGEQLPGRGSQHGSGDAGEQQDQEEFDRGGQRHGERGAGDRSKENGR